VRRLEGLGTALPKFEVGDGPCIRLPNILRSTVIGCEANYELTKKGLKEEFFCSEIKVFGQEKGHIRVIYVIYQSDFRQQRQTKDRQNRIDD